MIVEYEGTSYKTYYYPFFRIRRGRGFDVYTITYPSCSVEEFLVFDVENPRPALEEYLVHCIKEYLLEDDDMLTSRALRIKKDLMDMLEIINAE